MSEKKFIIDERLAHEILNYLNLRPHGEVRKMIDELMAIEEVKESEIAEPKEAKAAG